MLAVFFLFACGRSPTAACEDSPSSSLDAEEIVLLDALNAYRADAGVGPLTACRSLNRAAQLHSEDQRDNDYFEHTGRNGSMPWDRACDACFELGCGPLTAMAENIAAGNADGLSTLTQWQTSPGHDANQLDASFTQIGLGRALGGGEFGVYWTAVFAGDAEASCD